MISERNKVGYENYRKSGGVLMESYINGTFKQIGWGAENTLKPAEIVIENKKITAIPKWENGSTGEEVMEWWIR